MEEQQLFGKLFKTVPLYSEEHLEVILQTINKESANFFMIQAVKHAFDSGVYTIGETEILSKCIRLLAKKEEEETVKEDSVENSQD
jgi:hypothetical protein